MDGKFKVNYSKFEPYKGCPSLAWLIARRVTGKITLDCTICIVGPKGTGKSMFSVNLANEIARCIVLIKHKKELLKVPPSDRRKKLDELSLRYFNIHTHLKSVDPDGTFDLFSGDVMTTENSIMVADDVSVSASNRDAMTSNNKALGKIITISRPFRGVVILNCVYSNMLDKAIRGFADIMIETCGIDTKRNRSMVKAYLYSVNQTSGREYKKYFKYKGMRITHWFSPLPPKELKEEYEKVRLDKTFEMIASLKEQKLERDSKGKKKDKPDMMELYKDKVMEMYNRGERIHTIVKSDSKLSTYWVEKIIAANKQ